MTFVDSDYEISILVETLVLKKTHVDDAKSFVQGVGRTKRLSDMIASTYVTCS
jgi:hypothetical protein